MQKKSTYILAIESSCDDTSVAILENDKVLSNVVANQKIHAQYGGVVPELASRAHQQNIVPVVDSALKIAQIDKKELDAKGEDIDQAPFRYPGPLPFSKETAILMMADSVEAASKSLKEPTYSKLETFVENIIDKQMEQGQFLNADITFKEIQSIKKVLKKKLSNIYHLRVEYPE